MKFIREIPFIIILLVSLVVHAQPSTDNSGAPLDNFSRFIGGEWHLGDSYQTFEWGVGKKSVKAKGYFMVDGKAQLVSEGMWFQHPETGQIKGYFTAINMGVEFFEYTTRFEGDEMINELTSYSKDGKPEHFKEIWEFTGEDTYTWTLYSKEGEELMKVMGGKYIRK